MKVIKTEFQQGLDCSECESPGKEMVLFKNDFICLDCLDAALKMLLTEIERRKE